MGKSFNAVTADFKVESPSMKLKKLYSYFLYCDQNQSTTREILSAKYIIYKYGKDPSNCSMKIQHALKIILDKYFDSVTVKVNHTSGSFYKLLVDIKIVDGNIKTSLYKEIHTDGGYEIVKNEINELYEATEINK